MMSMTTCAGQLALPLFATAESVAQNKKTTLIAKSRLCKSNSKERKLSKTLAVDSTTSEEDYFPYWSDYIAGKNSKLWLPTKTVLQDLALNSLSGWRNKTVARSWFSAEMTRVHKKNLSTIFCPSCIRSLADCTDLDATIVRSKKIRLYLTAEQRTIVKQWIGVTRYVYNKTVEYLNQPDTVASWKAIKGDILGDLPAWAKDAPYQSKSVAIRDACVAMSEVKRKNKIDKQRKHKLRFKSRKHPKQSCYIPKSAVKPKGLYHTKLGKIRYSESLPDNIRDSRLVVHQGRYYVTIPTQVQRRVGENQARVVALDPGVRCFQAFFSENSCGFLGRFAIGKIQRLCQHLDDLISRSTKVLAKRRYRMRKACNRMRHKIRDLVDEMHHKVACFLVKNFDVILLPKFEPSNMVKRGKRNLRRKSVRQMLTLSHYRFSQFLKHKAFEYGKLVIDANEAYTSKTVSWTGEVIDSLGGRKTVTGNDGQTMDRDLNGARGIFLRALGDHPPLQQASICNGHR